MSKTRKIKICGLTRSKDVAAAIEYGADFLGFIIETKSKRRLSIPQATHISLPAKGIIPRIAVTVNATRQQIEQITSQMQPDYIQFHGDETPEHIARISQDMNIKTIKAQPVSNLTDINHAMKYCGFTDYLLFDAKPPQTQLKAEVARGGHGVSFNWNILQKAALPKIWFLAGGLTPDNVKDALQTGAPILDVSSGIESAPGIKDHEKLKAFISTAKGQSV